jgi:hypothetical protein
LHEFVHIINYFTLTAPFYPLLPALKRHFQAVINVFSTDNTTVSADAHNFASISRLNWRPRRFKWTRPLHLKTKSGFCACAITLQLHYIIRILPPELFATWSSSFHVPIYFLKLVSI